MVLRVFLILAILAGIGTVAVTQFMVRPHIETIIAERDTNKNNWQRELARANKLDRDLKTTQETLATTEKNLEETKTQLAVKTQQAEEQTRRADTLQTNLDTTMREKNEAQQKLAAWDALGIPVNAVKQVIESEKRFRELSDVLRLELKAVTEVNRKLTNTIFELRGGDEQIVEMPGVKGTIVAVDPKWNFVVLDVGEKAGARQKGIFMVSRNGKLIGKVKVATVQPDRSIANIVPGWQLEEIMEGDQVIHQF
jgi:Tfp pilus assembly protein PilE